MHMCGGKRITSELDSLLAQGVVLGLELRLSYSAASVIIHGAILKVSTCILKKFLKTLARSFHSWHSGQKQENLSTAKATEKCCVEQREDYWREDGAPHQASLNTQLLISDISRSYSFSTHILNVVLKYENEVGTEGMLELYQRCWFVKGESEGEVKTYPVLMTEQGEVTSVLPAKRSQKSLFL